MTRANRPFVVFAWTFAPPDYFEELVSDRDDHTIRIERGRVEVRIDASLYDADSSLLQAVQDTVNDWFLSAQLAKGAHCELSAPTITREQAGTGQRPERETERSIAASSTAQPEAARATHTAHDARARSKQDPGRSSEPLDCLGISDPLLDPMLQQYDAALSDSQHELSLLYGVAQVLVSEFGSEQAAGAALGVSEFEWRRLAQLINIEREGGDPDADSPESAAQASEAERAEARATVLRIILAYHRHRNAGPDSASD